MKTDFRASKKQTVRYFRKNTPKNETELNAIRAIYIVVVVVLIFTPSFLIILFFYFISFYSSYPRLFHVRTCVPCVQVATPLLNTFPLRLITSCSRKVFYLMPFPRKIHRQTPFKDDRAASKSVLLIVKKKKQTKQQKQCKRISWLAMNE